MGICFMKLHKWLKRAIIVAACCGMLAPAPLMQAAVAERTSSGLDVELLPGGVLRGQVIDVEGTARQRMLVTLHHSGRRIAAAVTDRTGSFALAGLGGGRYEITAGQAFGSYRIWAPSTAPPAARRGVLLVVGEGGLRGQTGPIAFWLGNPWLVAGIAAAAVSIPVAIHNNRVDRTASP